MNSDYDQRVIIDTNALEWEPTDKEGVFRKLLSSGNRGETVLLKLEQGAVLSNTSAINSVELWVLEGEYVNEFGVFEAGSYLRLPREEAASVTTDGGCVVFRKRYDVLEGDRVILSTSSMPWHPGQGRLEVLPLYEQTALVKWPAGEKFLPHKHWGGEEILVLQGIFIDEHGRYPAGTWMRSPHLSTHFPYVEEETIIWVKTGHL